MSQSFTLIVHGATPDSQAGALALRFADAVLDRGHSLYRIFFYHDAVTVANALRVTPEDEPDQASAWLALAERCGVELAVCIAAAQRRGVINSTEQQRYQKSAASALAGFAIVGLGQMIDAAAQADHCITFPAN
ncbi:MAG: sulfurtransferase complex subunit TusD [Pseudomonadales bacterium]